MLVRLHKRSEHVLRFEIFKDQDLIDYGKIVSLISNNAKDITLPGYPYGLIKADRFARVSEHEREFLHTQLSAKFHIEDKTVHQVLDNMY